MRNKIINRFYIQISVLSIFLTAIVADSNSQKRLRVIKKYAEYNKSVKKDSSKKMIELKTIVPRLAYDLRYATLNNFMHERLYKNDGMTFLRTPAATALAMAQRELINQGFALKIWDAYRPYNVTVRMWQRIKDERYVANPKNGSGHNRGIAVDLTLVKNSTGAEVDMGTDFDNFSDTARSDFVNLAEEILGNRKLLKTTMENYGFKSLETEWWHFYWKDATFEVLDINAKKFIKN